METNMTRSPAAYPRITVITPSYNQGRFLNDCIESILAQRYPNLEYIVIDGGSTDESLGILERQRRHISYWVSEPDGGQSEAINKGFRKATGDLVAWLNADDFYLPGAFQTVAEVYRKHPDASFYFGDGLRVDEAGRTLSRFSPRTNDTFDRTALLFGLNYVLQPATFINRLHLARIPHLDTELRYGLDTDLWLRLSAFAAPMAIPACLAASREYETTKTSSGSFHRVEELRRIAEKHSGLALTPGALCYFLDTLHRLARSRPDVYPPAFLTDIEWFWKVVRGFLRPFGARHDGFPLEKGAGEEPATDASEPLVPAGLVEHLRAELRAAREEIEALRQNAVKRRMKQFSARMFRLVTRES
jgi:glycosyltransferase involved in cell wall biosynthesis